jgi:hypothetical protein
MRGDYKLPLFSCLIESHRHRTLSFPSIACRSTAKLQAANQVLAETADIGVNIMDTMQQQRESLIRSKDKSADVNSLAYRARTIMRGIQRRAITNKALLGLVVLILLVLIGVVVYFGWGDQLKGGGGSNTPAKNNTS